MTRKDYIIIAAVFKARMDALQMSTVPGRLQRMLEVRVTAEAMADQLKYDNSRFDHDRFLTACGVTKELA